jgi:predicted transcriptional regulator
MRKSKLESYAEILEALVNKPLTADQIAYKINADCLILKQLLGFLIQNHVVEERESEKKTLYAITEKGIAVLRTLNFPKYLGQISSNMRLIDEATEIIRKLEKNKWKNEAEK